MGSASERVLANLLPEVRPACSVLRRVRRGAVLVLIIDNDAQCSRSMTVAHSELEISQEPSEDTMGKSEVTYGTK
jgi:hypothetical protein